MKQVYRVNSQSLTYDCKPLNYGFSQFLHLLFSFQGFVFVGVLQRLLSPLHSHHLVLSDSSDVSPFGRRFIIKHEGLVILRLCYYENKQAFRKQFEYSTKILFLKGKLQTSYYCVMNAEHFTHAQKYTVNHIQTFLKILSLKVDKRQLLRNCRLFHQRAPQTDHRKLGKLERNTDSFRHKTSIGI